MIIFYRDGTYKVTRVQEKVFIGETERSKAEKRKAEVIHIAVFKKTTNALYIMWSIAMARLERAISSAST